MLTEIGKNLQKTRRMKMAVDVKKELLHYAQSIEKFLADEFINGNDRLVQAMKYSVEAGGKRIRPALCLAWGKLAGESEENLLPFAAAIECIHTYSLIHDDLPAMDDDDLRRGRPSCHKQFDEATAILAGDALLTDAFAMMLSAKVPSERLVAATKEMALAAGSSGMVGGQMLDMLYTGQKGINLERLKKMHAGKTGAMLAGSCVSGAILAGNERFVEAARIFGAAIGIAFQIVDDVLDIVGDEKTLGKPVGSDEEQGKVTYPSLVGIEESRRLAELEVRQAKNVLADFSGADKDFLAALADYLLQRIS